MKVSEAIEDLEKKRDNALSFRNLYAPAESGWNANQQKADVYSAAIRVVKQIDEPQAEKVEITERQAQLLEAYEGETLYALLGECNEYEQELLAKAYLFGYTVKPKRWVVTTTDSDTCYLKRFRMGKECLDGDISKVWVGELGWAFTFDDKSKAEAVAVLVEGSVEEV